MTDSLTTLRLLEALIACPSVTPADAGCQDLIAARLEAQGFVCETMPFGPDQARVTHLGAGHRGASPGPEIVLAGHTGLVPTEPLAAWISTESSAEQLQSRVEDLLVRHGLEFKLDWTLGGSPFLTRPDPAG